jgi:hypothetical protein
MEWNPAKQNKTKHECPSQTAQFWLLISFKGIPPTGMECPQPRSASDPSYKDKYTPMRAYTNHIYICSYYILSKFQRSDRYLAQ